jgi:hypothetical protein
MYLKNIKSLIKNISILLKNEYFNFDFFYFYFTQIKLDRFQLNLYIFKSLNKTINIIRDYKKIIIYVIHDTSFR